jgi:prepilin-type processing-associated H-X9-DG protein
LRRLANASPAFSWQPWGEAGSPAAVAYHPTTAHPHPSSAATFPNINVWAYEQPSAGIAPASPDDYIYMQDYRDMGPVHAGSCNVLFADGSIRTFKDLNGDGYLNPGFDPVGATAADIQKIGYTDATVELEPALIFSGVFITPSPIGKLNLD